MIKINVNEMIPNKEMNKKNIAKTDKEIFEHLSHKLSADLKNLESHFKPVKSQVSQRGPIVPVRHSSPKQLKVNFIHSIIVELSLFFLQKPLLI